MDAADYWVRLVGSDGVRREGPLSVMWSVMFEAVPPSRSFPSYRGQRNFTGWYWSATGGGHVPHESWLERDHLMRLDFDPAVVGMAAQPFALSWRDGGMGPLTHTPDFTTTSSRATGGAGSTSPSATRRRSSSPGRNATSSAPRKPSSGS
ncbi:MULTISPECIES: TnsA-like heteromeric transposase endonuclease subunit [unclassified Streptomyces]|uniref:TnsA-like heteromeric transposase endonuclease subunit n=1 Tax=unclassified Streptomyces TaxID=2593676 RepID=UPI0027E287A2|nr:MULTISPECIES: TnsA-like heteromeric transposase endonuclease subunit [unclassified Streptomyces]